MRILVVDDDRINRAAMRSTLHALDDVVIEEFAHPGGALERAGEVEFDVAVLDYLLPGMDGVELAWRLREVTPRLPIVFVTGSRGELARRAVALGPVAIFPKPWVRATVVDTVDATRGWRQPG
jgi:CheY-like chemotaxis protein